jgi:hypothetical protein
MAVQQPQTKVLKSLVIGKDIKTADSLVKEIGRPLGSPINGYKLDDVFTVTLTGKIEIREFNGVKGAYFTTKQGISIRVNASFDPSIHKEGAEMKCVCREFPRENGQPVKFAAFAEN